MYKLKRDHEESKRKYSEKKKSQKKKITIIKYNEERRVLYCNKQTTSLKTTVAMTMNFIG